MKETLSQKDNTALKTKDPKDESTMPTFRFDMRSTSTNNPLFDRSHIQGYYGIKTKYIEKSKRDADQDRSYTTTFYRS